MRCDVLAVGTELLLGQITDTNSVWIADQLAELGIDSYEHRHVGDNLERIVDALTDMTARADAVIVCGGLGPTQDDITREAIARFLGVSLETDPKLAAEIEERFKVRGREMSSNNLRQAEVPAGAVALRNPLGTAPGIRAEANNCLIYAVPGVPTEMEILCKEVIFPELSQLSGTEVVIRSRVLKTWGSSESAIAERISVQVEAQTNPTIAFLARGVEGIWLRLTAKTETKTAADELIRAVEDQLREMLGELVFGADAQTMESVVLEQLRTRRWTLGVAESLTGGLVSSRLINTPGASDVVRAGVVAYATDIKQKMLGVRTEQSVSEQCVLEMATGVREYAGADVGLAVTGVAGPDPLEGQPVGTVWFGLALPNTEPVAVHTRLLGSRQTIRNIAAISLLNLLRLQLVDQ